MRRKRDLNLSISGDSSWKKRGFLSLFGVTTLITYHTGKVIDLIVKNSYCQTCLYFKNNFNDVEYETHKENCHINHKGSSGKMEVDAMLEMFHKNYMELNTIITLEMETLRLSRPFQMLNCMVMTL